MAQLANSLNAFLGVTSRDSADYKALTQCVTGSDNAEQLAIFYTIPPLLVVPWRSGKRRNKRDLVVIAVVRTFNGKSSPDGGGGHDDNNDDDITGWVSWPITRHRFSVWFVRGWLIGGAGLATTNSRSSSDTASSRKSVWRLAVDISYLG